MICIFRLFSLLLALTWLTSPACPALTAPSEHSALVCLDSRLLVDVLRTPGAMAGVSGAVRGRVLLVQSPVTDLLCNDAMASLHSGGQGTFSLQHHVSADVGVVIDIGFRGVGAKSAKPTVFTLQEEQTGKYTLPGVYLQVHCCWSLFMQATNGASRMFYLE